ncbi:MAG: hypothetical protein RIB45_14550 [Marivibrio sp.]|uniref:hypothetical protein n=1 Tax=Marivibrio sp. TaxID=2039719 RepID=UPI0032EFDFB6
MLTPRPAAAQLEEIFNPLTLDPVTREVMTNAFTQLRFLAISLEGEDETGQALNGIVRARLARGERAEAMDEISRIADPIWAGRSLVAVADFDREAGDPDEARALLRRASEGFQRAADRPIRDGGEVLRVVAVRQAEVGDLDGAIATARLIPDPRFRVQALQETASASLVVGDADAAARQAAARLLEEAFEQARAIAEEALAEPHGAARLMIAIGRAQTRAGATPAARRTFAAARARITEGPETGRFDAYAELAAAMIEGEDAEEAMQVVRLIPEGAARAEAIGSVARARGEFGELDSAVPLFRLAMEETERIDNKQARFDAIHHLMVEMSKVGRLADAFTLAGGIDDRYRQSEALLDMGEVLLGQEKYSEALVLTEYIPFIELRAQIFGPVAMHRGLEGEPSEASGLLTRALEATGFAPRVDQLPEALRRVLQAQTRAGEPAADAAVFARARDLIDLIPGDIQKVRALVQIAIAEAQRGRIGNAQKTISAAYRIAWENNASEGFNAALEDIALAQIAAGDVLSAFDTAARIPDPRDGDSGDARPARAPDGSFLEPRFRALTRVAAASARLGETDLAIRAAQQMDYASARAAGLAAVAVAMAAPQSDLLEIVGEAGRTDFGVEAPRAAPTLGEAPALGEAPPLAPDAAEGPAPAPAVAGQPEPAQAPAETESADPGAPQRLLPGE